MNQINGQYFSLSKLTSIMMESGSTDYYLRQHENRIGIVFEGSDYFYLTYLEDNVFQYDTCFEYLQTDENNFESNNENNSNIQDSQFSSNTVQQLQYCFCGKVQYFFINQYFGKIEQIELKTQIQNNKKIKTQKLYDMRSQKNTEILVLLYQQNSFEIRNTQNFDLMIQLELASLPNITDININNSIIILEFFQGIHSFFQIRPNKFHQLSILYGNTCKIYSKLLILQQKENQFKFYYKFSKPKFLRKVYLQINQQSTYKFIQKQDKIFLKEKSQNFVKFSFYKWCVGSFHNSNFIKQQFEGQITSREAKEQVYILEYKSINLDNSQNQESIQGFSSPLSQVYDRYAWG